VESGFGECGQGIDDSQERDKERRATSNMDLRLFQSLRKSAWFDLFLKLLTCGLRIEVQHDQLGEEKHACESSLGPFMAESGNKYL
jgi:hypothetical protein